MPETPNHFSSIGFRFKIEKEFRELVQRMATLAQRIETNKGAYYRWTSDAGAELWIQVNGDNELVGMNPHFAGPSLTKVSLTGFITRDAGIGLDGGFDAWADPSEDEGQQGAYPFVFDCPDYALHEGLSLPSVAQVQIAAFAHNLIAYDSEDTFKHSKDGQTLGPESFIPSGLFSPGGKTTEPPQAYAIFTGRILAAEQRTNTLTGHSFWWAQVHTYAAVIDVVADPVLVTFPLPVGGILSGSFWLSGRIH